MASSFTKTGVRKVTVTESQTVSQLLDELKLTNDHVVFVNGKVASSDTLVDENDMIIVLPLIAGG